MALFCGICNKKLGLLDEPIMVDFSDGQKQRLCSECKNRRASLLFTSSSDKEVIKAKEYFTVLLKDEGVSQLSKDTINMWIESGTMRREEKAAEEKEIEEQKLRELQFVQEYIDNRKKYEKFVTTAYSFEGYKITEHLGLVSGEAVLGTGFVSELGAGISDFFGTSSQLFANKMSAVKSAATARLINESIKKGGNAIIAVDFDYVTFSNNMIAVSANGTAVKIEKI